MGGGGIELGQAIPMDGAAPFFTVSSKEYLRTGFLKAYEAKYDSFKTVMPQGSFIDFTPLATTTAMTGATFTQGGIRLFHDGTNYVLALSHTTNNTTYAWYSSNLVVWNAVTNPSVMGYATDFAKIGTTIVSVCSDSTNQLTIRYKTAGSTGWDGVSNTQFSHNSLAVNTAENYIVATRIEGTQAGTNGAVYTSVNGTAWTARTISGGNNFTMYCIFWSPCANAFFVLGQQQSNSVSMNRTTDGFTHTGVWNNDTSFSINTSLMSAASKGYIASSPTVTIISGENGKIRRTTDGANWTVINMNSFYPSITGQNRIMYDPVNARFLYTVSESMYGTFYLRSTDGGVTWTPTFSYRADASTLPQPNVRSSGTLLFANNKIVNVFMNESGLVTVADVTNDVWQTNPDWIGSIGIRFFGNPGISANYAIPAYTRIL
jgi:hypothetical protein